MTGESSLVWVKMETAHWSKRYFLFFIDWLFLRIRTALIRSFPISFFTKNIFQKIYIKNRRNSWVKFAQIYFFTNISFFDQYLDFGLKIHYLEIFLKLSILQKFWFFCLDNLSVFGQMFDLWQKFWFLEYFRFLYICLFGK